MFWPAAQSVNFRFVPGQFRVAYVSSATLIWNSMLSYFKHSDVGEFILYHSIVKSYFCVYCTGAFSHTEMKENIKFYKVSMK